MNKKAFTLAEVLITLGIIGVVSAMTLPSVITKYQKQSTVARLKKIYSVMYNAVNMSIADNGDMNTWDFPESSYDSRFIPFFRKYYMPYLNIVEECVDSNCFIKENYKPTSYSGTDESGCAYAGYFVKLSDGTYLYFLSNIPAGYIWMFADINGKKKPNIIGKDIFVFDIYKYNEGGYKVKFWNINANINHLAGSESYGCNKETTHFQGFNCGALIQKSGWEIPDNYPW